MIHAQSLHDISVMRGAPVGLARPSPDNKHHSKSKGGNGIGHRSIWRNRSTR